MRSLSLSAAIAAAIHSLPTLAAEVTVLDEIVVTAPQMQEPLTVDNNPKLPQQPVPANDGASFLKNIPGFNVIRKGGTDGDPVLRGQAGSRLNLLIDGAELLGGCGMRMDPPSAYVFPETFDRVTVLKGPQTVRYGNGNSAGVVLFDREPAAMQKAGAQGFASVMAGSWGRLDGVADASMAGTAGYVRGTATHAESDDYQTGGGDLVHSFYSRKSLNGAAGWTPDPHTRVEFSAVTSEAEAAYADRSMDGVRFDREGYGLKLERSDLTPWLQNLSFQAYHSFIDHVMDNYSLRNKAPTAMFMSNNPDRETQGVKASADLSLGRSDLMTLGADWRNDEHGLRTYSNMMEKDIDRLNRNRDMETSIMGVFAEWRHELSAHQRLISGLRYDDYTGERFNNAYGGVNARADFGLKSGFLRYEQDLVEQPMTAFIGLGHVERPFDYWEASTYKGLMPTGHLDPERTTELDAGLIWKTSRLNASLSAFYAKVDDYILTWNQGTPDNSRDDSSMNVDATRYGAEADLAWNFLPTWTLRSSLAYVRGENDTRDTPLAQTPPLEGRIGLAKQWEAWTFGGLVRLVAAQDRVDLGYGNIVGQDLQKTPGFATLALHVAYQPHKQVLFSLGVDNVFDREYAEHLSRTGAMVGGYTQNSQVDEPGRFFWAKLNYRLD